MVAERWEGRKDISSGAEARFLFDRDRSRSHLLVRDGLARLAALLDSWDRNNPIVVKLLRAVRPLPT
jgi:hypothetical protein